MVTRSSIDRILVVNALFEVYILEGTGSFCHYYGVERIPLSKGLPLYYLIAGLAMKLRTILEVVGLQKVVRLGMIEEDF